MWGALAGLGLGLVKQKEDAKKAQKQNILNAYTQLYSPWTGMQSDSMQYAPSLLGSAGEGALQGMAVGQDIENYGANKNLQEAQLRNLNEKTSLYSRIKNPKMPIE